MDQQVRGDSVENLMKTPILSYCKWTELWLLWNQNIVGYSRIATNGDSPEQTSASDTALALPPTTEG